jgi:hypothetical protein
MMGNMVWQMFKGCKCAQVVDDGGITPPTATTVILSALASFLPTQSASRLTVREVLAYE